MASLEQLTDAFKQSASEKTVQELILEQRQTTKAIEDLHNTIAKDIQFDRRQRLDELEEKKKDKKSGPGFFANMMPQGLKAGGLGVLGIPLGIMTKAAQAALLAAGGTLAYKIATTLDERIEAGSASKVLGAKDPKAKITNRNFTPKNVASIKNTAAPDTRTSSGLRAPSIQTSVSTIKAPKISPNFDLTTKPDPSIKKTVTPDIANINVKPGIVKLDPSVMESLKKLGPTVQTSIGKLKFDPSTGRFINLTDKNRFVKTDIAIREMLKSVPSLQLPDPANVNTPKIDTKSVVKAPMRSFPKFNSTGSRRTNPAAANILRRFDKGLTVGALGALNPYETTAELVSRSMAASNKRLFRYPGNIFTKMFNILGSTGGMAAQFMLLPNQLGDGTITGGLRELYVDFVRSLMENDQPKSLDLQKQIQNYEKMHSVTLPEMGFEDVSKLKPGEIKQIGEMLRKRDKEERLRAATKMAAESELIAQRAGTSPLFTKRTSPLEGPNPNLGPVINPFERRFDPLMPEYLTAPMPFGNMPIVAPTTNNINESKVNQTILNNSGTPNTTDNSHGPY